MFRLGRRAGAAAVALFALLTLALFFRLGEERVWRHSEQRCLAVVTTMVQSGDWLVPRLGGVPRLGKPPLAYWTGALGSEVLGGVSALPLRAVSALAGLALALCVVASSASAGDALEGLTSAAALGASALFVVRARTGDAEMLLALLCTAALLAFERLDRARDRRLLPAVALLLAIGFLTKGTAVLVNAVLPIGLWLALRRELHLLLRPSVLAWAAAGAALALSWYAYIVWAVPDAFHMFLGNAAQPLGAPNAAAGSDHFRSVLYYLPRFPLQTLPASLLLPWVVVDGVRTHFWRDDARMRFLATSALAVLVGWSLVPQKQMHYLLPLAPLQAALVGHTAAARLRAFARRRAPRARTEALPVDARPRAS